VLGVYTLDLAALTPLTCVWPAGSHEGGLLIVNTPKALQIPRSYPNYTMIGKVDTPSESPISHRKDRNNRPVTLPYLIYLLKHSPVRADTEVHVLSPNPTSRIAPIDWLLFRSFRLVYCESRDNVLPVFLTAQSQSKETTSPTKPHSSSLFMSYGIIRAP